MMKVIFECETEIGKCDCDILPMCDETNERLATIIARTEASLNGHRGMFKVEHLCYLRCGTDVPEQPWIRPQLILEPALPTQAEMIAFAKEEHERFIDRVRSHFRSSCCGDGWGEVSLRAGAA